MKKAKIRRRILSFLLAVCMMIPCFSVQSYATENTEPSNEAATCTCAEKCVGDSINEYCDVCGVDYSGCTGEDVAVVYEGENVGETTPEEEESGSVVVPAEAVEPEGSTSGGESGEGTATEATKYTVQATSFLLGSGEKVANIAMDPTDGIVGEGESVTVTATQPDNLLFRCNFLGWYLSSDIDDEGTGLIAGSKPWFTDYTAMYTVENDVELVAVYEPAGKASVNIKGGNCTVTVKGNSEPYTGNSYSSDLKIGTKVTVTVPKDDNDFLSWQNENKKIVTMSKNYTFTVTGNVTLTMSRKGTSSNVVVEFVSESGQVIARETCNKNNYAFITIPEGPSKMGYTFIGWSHDQARILEEIKKGETYIEVTPKYEALNGSTYSVDVYINGTKDTEQSKDKVSAGDKMIITAEAQKDNKVFLYWATMKKVGEDLAVDKVLGYDTSYGMKINKDISIYAVYGETAVEQKKPVILVTDVYTTVENSKNKITFSVTRNVPTGYTVVEHGMLAYKNNSSTGFDLDDDAFVLGASGVTKFSAASNTRNGVYTLSVNMTGEETKDVVVRGYLIVKKAGSAEEIYYTDVTGHDYTEIYNKEHEGKHVHEYGDAVDQKNGTHTKTCKKEGCTGTDINEKDASVTEKHTPVYSVSGTRINVKCQECDYTGWVELRVDDIMTCQNVKDADVDEENVVGQLYVNDKQVTEITVDYTSKSGAATVLDGGTETRTPGTWIASVTLGDATVSKEFVITHIDKETIQNGEVTANKPDGKCDEDGAFVSFEINAMSLCLTNSKPVGAVSVSPSNRVNAGDAVTVTAQGLLDYKFIGWYSKESVDIDTSTSTLKDDAKVRSTSYSYTYTPNADETLVAVYEKIAKNVKVNIKGSSFKVSVNGDDATAYTDIYSSSEEISIGDKVTLIATDKDFMNWLNAQNRIVTTDQEYTFTVTGDVTLTMSKKVAEEVVRVEFVTDYNQIVYSFECDKTNPDLSGVEIPAGPVKVGYEFAGWYYGGTKVDTTDGISMLVSTAAAGTTITITPEYTWIPKTCMVTVYVNGIKDTEQSGEVYEGATKTVKAPAKTENDTKVFSHWTDGAGTILGYDTSYTMKVVQRIDLKAVYVDAKVTVEKKPTVIIEKLGKNSNVTFSVTRHVPEGYKLVEHGIVAMRKYDGVSEIVLGASGVTKFVGNQTELSGVYMLTVDMVSANTDLVGARGYLIVQKEDSTVNEVYYTEVSQYEYSTN